MKHCYHCYKENKRPYSFFCSVSCRKKEYYLRTKKSLNYYYKFKNKVLKYQIERLNNKYKYDIEYRKKRKIRQLTQNKISLKNKNCLVCDSDFDLQRHHPYINDPINHIILCRSCHNKIHKLWPSISDKVKQCSQNKK